MKKFLSLLLLVMMSASSIPAASAGISKESYIYLTQQNIVQGVGNTGDLKLGDEINRAELMKIVVVAALGKQPDISTYSSCFSDIQKQWFAPYICWAKQEGYVEGYPDGLFHPEKKVTEAEALKIIHEVFHIRIDHFLALKSGNWYAPYVYAAKENGILLNGVEERLHKNALRADIFEEVSRAMTLQETGEHVYKNTDTEKLIKEPSIEPLSEAHTHVFSLMKAVVAYGMQNQAVDEKGTMHINLSGNDFTAQIQIDAKEFDKITGSSDEMNKAQSDIDIRALITANGAGETMDVDMNATISLLFDSKKGIFMKLSSFTIDPNESSTTIKETIDEMNSRITPVIGTWYSLPLDMLGDSEESMLIGQSSKKQLMEFLDALIFHLSYKANFLVVTEDIQSLNGINVPHYTISIDEEQFNKSIPALIKAVSSEKDLNHFEIRAQINALRPYLKKIFAQSSLEIWANETNDKLTKTIARLLPVAFIFPQESQVFSIDTVLLDLLAEGTYSYPLSIEITTPESSTPLLEDTGLLQ